jgi:hypothetical protein
MISIQLIDTKNACTKWKGIAKQNFITSIGIPDHAWEMHDKKSWHFVAVENDVVIGCVVLVPLLRNQNPINANGGRDEPTRQRDR